MQTAVERAIETMWHRYPEPLTLAELADAAILSRFYFSRIFRAATGTSPGRFLMAVRLYQAKRLLLATSRSVTDISYQVGYNSLGTFTSRFTSGVGVSPARYRHLSGCGMPGVREPSRRDDASGTVHGSIRLPDTGQHTRIYVGVFENLIAQGRPRAWGVVDTGDTYRLPGVPEGSWFVHAVAVATEDLDPRPWLRRPLLVNGRPAIRVSPGQSCRVDLDLRPSGTVDLPVLLALPELDGRTRSELALAGR